MTRGPRRPAGLGPARAALLVVLVAAVALGSVGVALAMRDDRRASPAAAPSAGADPRSPDRSVPRPRVDRFDGERAMRLAEMQLRAGPRPAGSRALARLRARLVERLPRGRVEAVRGHPGLYNVVGRLPGRRPAIVLGAHYDSGAVPPGQLGANDGAAGTAGVLEVARRLSEDRRRRGPDPRDREIRFVLFDGEEQPPGTREQDFEEVALRGSKDYAARYGREVSSLVLLDYIGNRGLRLPREGFSERRLWSRWRSAARRVGTDGLYRGEAGVEVVDDHVPFVRRGIPAIDLIDWTYPYRHTLEDTGDKLSRDALDAVGETTVEWARAERRR